MAETTPYFDQITSARALLLSEEEALAGNVTLSLETQRDLAEDDIYSFIDENFAVFMRILRFLKKEDQELMLSYYLLSKAQNTLAVIHHTTQTVCSFQIRMAVKTMGTFLMMGGTPSEELLHEVFTKAGFEDVLETVSLSKVVSEYARVRSFQAVAKTFNVHRPHIRRHMSKVSKALMDSDNANEAAVAAWIHSLIDKMSPLGTGFSKRKAKKMETTLYRHDKPIVGQFRINIEDPDIDQMFIGRACR
jgi:hypothetical protein